MKCNKLKMNSILLFTLALLLIIELNCGTPKWTKSMMNNPKMCFAVIAEKDFGKFIKLPDSFLNDIQNLLKEKKFIPRIIPNNQIESYFTNDIKTQDRIDRIKKLYVRDKDEFLLLLELSVTEEYFQESDGKYAFKVICKSSFVDIKNDKISTSGRSERYYLNNDYNYINDITKRFLPEIKYLIFNYVESYKNKSKK